MFISYTSQAIWNKPIPIASVFSVCIAGAQYFYISYDSKIHILPYDDDEDIDCIYFIENHVEIK